MITGILMSYINEKVESESCIKKHKFYFLPPQNILQKQLSLQSLRLRISFAVT